MSTSYSPLYDLLQSYSYQCVRDPFRRTPRLVSLSLLPRDPCTCVSRLPSVPPTSPLSSSHRALHLSSFLSPTLRSSLGVVVSGSYLSFTRHPKPPEKRGVTVHVSSTSPHVLPSLPHRCRSLLSRVGRPDPPFFRILLLPLSSSLFLPEDPSSPHSNGWTTLSRPLPDALPCRQRSRFRDGPSCLS